MTQSISPSGLFQPYVALATPGSVPAAVAIGDLNGDGRNDVALVAPLTLLVFLQTPSGALVRSVNQVVGYSRSVALGDLNGDGRLDVVVGNAGSIGVLLQSQSGTLLPMVEYPTPHASSYVVKTGDFNGDGLTDVVAIAWGNSDVAVYLQNATHALDPPVPYQVDHAGYADAVEVGDINGDGRDDIVVMAGQYYANLGILLQNPDGSLGPVVYYGLGGNRLPLGVAVGDVNGDSRRDVAVTYEGQFGGAGLGVFTQNSGGTLNALLDFPCTAESPCSGGVEAVVVADVDGDGREDV
ncbi:MAG: hypothetical protein DMF79_13250, partial [Acidobacteria bacterium]